MEENKIMSAPSVDRNSNALATLLAEVEKSLALHDYVTGGVDYGYISTGLQAAFDAVKSAAPQQVDAVQAVPEGWLIEWTGPDGTKYSELSRHNSVANYRYIDENATGTALVRAALASPSPAVPPEPMFDNIEFTRLMYNYRAAQDGPALIAAFDALNAYAHPVAAQGAVLEWQPIESAPQDGRTLLLGCFNSMGKWRTMRGQWFTKEEIDQDWEETDGFDAGWYETAVEPDFPNCWAIAPSHWQPTPPAPLAQPTGMAAPAKQRTNLTLGNAPFGTKAQSITGGHWIKVQQGWKWQNGSTFPRPGGDWNGVLIAPSTDTTAGE